MSDLDAAIERLRVDAEWSDRQNLYTRSAMDDLNLLLAECDRLHKEIDHLRNPSQGEQVTLQSRLDLVLKVASRIDHQYTETLDVLAAVCRELHDYANANMVSVVGLAALDDAIRLLAKAERVKIVTEDGEELRDWVARGAPASES